MKVGVVGHGSIGRRHASNLLALGHEVLVYDPMLQPSARVKYERDIYDECEAVVVATPASHHEAALRACIERNRHVLIEKPVSIAVGSLPQLLMAAEDKGLVVMMGNNLRLHPCIQQAKLWVSSGDIGEPLWANFTCATEGGNGDEGVILNTGAHEVDVAQYLFGPGHCVSAYGDAWHAFFVLSHENETYSTFHLDYETPHRVREFWIAGSDANIGVDLDARRMSLGTEKPIQAPGSYDDDYRNEMAAFIGRIGGTFAPGATGGDGLAVLRTLLDVKKKAGIS